MVKFQLVTFYNPLTGKKIDKLWLFNSIFDNHTCMNSSTPFNVRTDVTCMLLDKNNHPDIRCCRRDFVDFNEGDVLKKATAEVMNRHAVSIIRQKVKTDPVSPLEAIGLVAYAMEQAYRHHEEIDKEIEQLVK